MHFLDGKCFWSTKRRGMLHLSATGIVPNIPQNDLGEFNLTY